MNQKWTSEQHDGKVDRLLIVLLISRNKDNKNLPGFKPRVRSFLAYENNPRIKRELDQFLADAKPGEMCRLYVSVNARDVEVIKKRLLYTLIFEKPSLTHLDPLLASIAAKKECASEHRWMFDFDSTDETLLKAFRSNLAVVFAEDEIQVYRTPHGYAVIVPHGFDTRQLMADYPCVTLKRDGMLCQEFKTAS